MFLPYIPFLFRSSLKTESGSEIRQENENLRNKNEKLRLEIAGLKSDPYEIEKIAREKFHMVKPDEKVFRVIDKRKTK